MDEATTPFLITERWLMKIAGWEIFVDAKKLFESGALQESRRKKNLIMGTALIKRRRWRAGLLIRTENDVENLCSCAAARYEGRICVHSVVVGYGFVKK